MVGTPSFLGQTACIQGQFVSFREGKPPCSPSRTTSPVMKCCKIESSVAGQPGADWIVDDNRPFSYMFYGMLCLVIVDGHTVYISISWIIMIVSSFIILQCHFDYASDLILIIGHHWSSDLTWLVSDKRARQITIPVWNCKMTVPYFTLKFWTMSHIMIVSQSCCFQKMYLLSWESKVPPPKLPPQEIRGGGNFGRGTLDSLDNTHEL